MGPPAKGPVSGRSRKDFCSGKPEKNLKFYYRAALFTYYPTLLPRVQISRETSTNNRYLYSPHSSRPHEVQNLGKSQFREKKSLDNKSLIRRFGV